MACSVSSAPCTSVVTASASAFCPARRKGFSAVCASSASISSWERKVKMRSSSPTFSSSTLSQNWWKAYGDIISRVEPERAVLGLAVLRAVGLGDQRGGEGMGLAAVVPADQLDAAGEVAPLVAAAELEPDAVVAVEVQVVHRLQQHVAELGVADAGLEPAAHHVAGEHPVDREVLADVAEEVDRGQARGPVVVVHHRGPVVALELEERLDLAMHLLDPALDGVERVERALPRLPGVTDHAGGTADQDVRRVPGQLQPLGREELDEVAHVQARSGRVEADVEPDGVLAQGLAERIAVRRVCDETAPVEVVRAAWDRRSRGGPPGVATGLGEHLVERGGVVGHGDLGTEGTLGSAHLPDLLHDLQRTLDGRVVE